jgi:hypothetical protein
MTEALSLPSDIENAPPPPVRRICPNCGDGFSVPSQGPGGHKRFCGSACRNDWGNREKAHGSVIVTLAKVWRKNRGSGEIGKAAFARLTEALDILLSDDDAAGRPKLLAGGPVEPFLRAIVEERYLDRRRR